MSDLLLPCPFCGQKAYIRKRHHSMPRDPTYQAYCDDCGCGTSDLYRQPALAIQAWNQRALAEIEPAPSDGGGAVSDLVERLREFGEMPMEGGKVDPVIETINGLAHEAADEIESLRTRITELEGERDTATRAKTEGKG